LEPSEAFKLFLTRKMMGELGVNPSTSLIEPQQISLSTSDLEDVCLEGLLYGYSRDYVIENVRKIYQQGFSFGTKTKEVRQLNTWETPNYQQLALLCSDGRQLLREELMKVGYNYFLLIDSERGSVKPGNFLFTMDSEWVVGGTAKLHFVASYDPNFQKPEGATTYQTGKIEHIYLIEPSELPKLLVRSITSLRKQVYAPFPNEEAAFDPSTFTDLPTQDTYFTVQIEEGRAVFKLMMPGILEKRQVVFSDLPWERVADPKPLSYNGFTGIAHSTAGLLAYRSNGLLYVDEKLRLVAR
jgi:hypothetical protein